MNNERKKIILLFPIPLLSLLGIVFNPLFSILAVLYIIFVIFQNDDVHNYYLGLFLIPNIRIFDNVGVSFLVNVILSIPLIFYLKNNYQKMDYRPFLWSFLLFIIEACHILIYGNYNSFFPTISSFTGMAFVISISMNDEKKINIHSAWLFFVLGIIMSSSVYLLSHIDYANDIVSKIILGYRFDAFANDPNYLSLYACCCLAFIFTASQFFLYHYIFMLLLIIFCLWTASKMCFVIMTMTLIIGFSYNLVHSNNRLKIKFSIISICILFVSSFIYFDKIFIFLNNLIKRAGLENGSANVEQLSTGRSNIVLNYFDILSSNYKTLFWGNGFNYNIPLNQHLIAHNSYLDIVLSWGILGMIVVGLILLSWLKCLKLQNKAIYYLPLLVMLINFCDISCLSATMFWWIISFCVNVARKYPQNHNEFICERNYIK